MSSERPSPLARKLPRFALVNLIVCTVAAASHGIGTLAGDGFASLWLSSCIRCALSVGVITWLTRRAAPIGPRRDGPTRAEARIIWLKVALLSAPSDALALTLAARLALGGGRSATPALLMRPAVFVLQSFVWELVFDFFHYWVHRACHSSPLAYRLVHKAHHRYAAPSPLTTFAHAPLDVLASNLVPALLAFCTLALMGAPIVGVSERQLLFAYKSYVEVAGHAGVDARPRSFPQFTWLPSAIPARGVTGRGGITAHTREHDWHHAVLRCNFSKRFRVWDILFGTYEEPPPLAAACEPAAPCDSGVRPLKAAGAAAGPEPRPSSAAGGARMAADGPASATEREVALAKAAPRSRLHAPSAGRALRHRVCEVNGFG